MMVSIHIDCIVSGAEKERKEDIHDRNPPGENDAQ